MKQRNQGADAISGAAARRVSVGRTPATHYLYTAPAYSGICSQLNGVHATRQLVARRTLSAVGELAVS